MSFSGSGTGSPPPLMSPRAPVNPIYVYIRNHISELRQDIDFLDQDNEWRGLAHTKTTSQRHRETHPETASGLAGFRLDINPAIVDQLTHELTAIAPDLIARLGKVAFDAKTHCHISVLVNGMRKTPGDAIPDSEDAPIYQDIHITLGYKDAAGELKYIRIYFDLDGRTACAPRDEAGLEIYTALKNTLAYKKIVDKVQELVALAKVEELEHRSSSRPTSTPTSPRESPAALLYTPAPARRGYSEPTPSIDPQLTPKAPPTPSLEQALAAESDEAKEQHKIANYYHFSLDVFSAIQEDLFYGNDRDPYDYMKGILEKYGFTFDADYGADLYFFDNIIYQDGIRFTMEQAKAIDDMLQKPVPGTNIIKKLFILDLIKWWLPFESDDPQIDALRDELRKQLPSRQAVRGMRDAFIETAIAYQNELAQLRVELGLVPRRDSRLT